MNEETIEEQKINPTVEILCDNDGTQMPDEQINFQEFSLFGNDYFEYSINGVRWIQQGAGERMLKVRTKQFDRYCKGMKPEVKKTRRKAQRYSYNFIKESDIYAMAEKYDKTIQVPYTEIPNTDKNAKIFSKEDVSRMGKELIEKEGGEVLQEYKERINYLEKRTEDLEKRNLDLELSNDDLNSKVTNLVGEKADLAVKNIRVEKDYDIHKNFADNNIKSQKTKVKWLAVLMTVVIIGIGSYAISIYITFQKKEQEVFDIRKKYEESVKNLQISEKAFLKTKGKLEVMTISQ